jgi:malonyl-CoA decarboxylase
MNTPHWLERGMMLLRSKTQPSATNTKPALNSLQDDHVTKERIEASIKKREQVLPERTLRKVMKELQNVIDPQVSEIEGGRRAKVFSQWYLKASAPQRMDVWLLISEFFGPDAKKVMAAKDEYTQAFGTPEEGAAEIKLRRSLISPRTRLFQRFAAFEGGLRFLMDMRAEMLPLLRSNKALAALDVELESLFSTWFDVAFLELRQLSWNSPASLIEKLIQYEAVHFIKSWADLKNRLDSDRRCYGFFHPNLPQEPLIFVEVALLEEMAQSITPLLDENAAPENLQKASVAIFYSISNTQPGLKGVGFGDSLIKRVVEVLKAEFPKLKTFATLSPIPGLRPWVLKNCDALLQRLSDKEQSALLKSLGLESSQFSDFLKLLEPGEVMQKNPLLQSFLMRAASVYLGQTFGENGPLDAVAKFHLHNGARVERINWDADPSSKGAKQSWGIMVNYQYDLKKLDRHRQLLAKGVISTSSGVQDLFLPAP